MATIYPAIMSLDSDQIEKLQKLQLISNRVHLDVMDNIFVPNITPGVKVINEFVKKNNFFIWVHLMVERPFDYYQQLALPPGSIVSFHIESTVDVFEMVKSIKEKKQLASIAISPKTPSMNAIDYSNVVDQILVMSVEPGFSGQPFLKEVLEKIEALSSYRQENNFEFRIAVDGGINKTNINILSQIGVDDYAVGSGILCQKDPVAALHELYDLASPKAMEDR